MATIVMPFIFESMDVLAFTRSGILIAILLLYCLYNFTFVTIFIKRVVSKVFLNNDNILFKHHFDLQCNFPYSMWSTEQQERFSELMIL